MKKGQGLSMDVIIIAAISLVVLVVLIAIFTGRLGKFTAEIKDCQAQGGTCLSEADCRSQQMAILPGKTSCSVDADNDGLPDANSPKCCISITPPEK